MFHSSKEPLSPEEVEATLTKIRGWIEKFKGTKNFHNYTKSMKATDPKAKRYIINMEVDVIVSEKYPTAQWVKFIIHGQSFIYHQIRKMMGIMVQIVHGGEKEQFLDNSFYQNTQKLWLAPPHGLLLNRVSNCESV